MAVKVTLLFIVPVIILVTWFSPSLGEPSRFRPQPAMLNATRRPVWIATRPKPTRPASAIPAKRCGTILNNFPRNSKGFRRPLCVRLNESQLLQKLKDVGGWNPRYMAINRRQTCQFTDLVSVDNLPRNSSDPVQSSQVKKKSMSPRRRGPSIRGCWSAGFQSGNLVRLCTECSATTALAGNVFPPFINEAICKGNFCHRGIGECIQRSIKFTFLRKTGMFELDDDLSEDRGEDVFVEKTVTFQQNVRSCCECRMFSFIRFCRR